MIRILEVLATLKRAGAENMVASLVCRLDRSRFAPSVVSLFDPFSDGLEPELERCGVPVRHLGKRPGFDPRMYSRLRRVVAELQPDIIHTHSYVMRYTIALPARAGVHTVHNVASREVEPLGRLIHRYAFRRGVVPVSIAGEVTRSFTELYGFSPAETIPNGIDVSAFYRPQARAEWRREQRFAEEDVLVVSVARLEPQKNPQRLIDAVQRVPGVRLLLVGDGSLRSGLRLHERVQLLGVRMDLPELLSACDIFALASDWEGRPLSLMEAMAAGLPVVATAVGGVPEVLGDAGVLVEPSAPEQLVEALRSLAENPERRRELGAAARARAEAFDVSRMVRAYEELFEKVLA